MPPPAYSQGSALYLYNVCRKWFTLASISGFFATFGINAPFGRFTVSENHPRFLVLDGIRSWIVMELVSPAAFLYNYLKSPLSYVSASVPPLMSPQGILAACYLIHYLNRAIINPLRTPSRSTSHVSVFLSGVLFNTVNGSLMGAYLSSPYARIFLSPGFSYSRTTFWVGLALWALGFAGNVLHDEILLDIRRKAQVKGKSKADTDDEGEDKKENGNKGKKRAEKKPKQKGEYYGIPQGWLYDYISYPNYFCEWIEWTGFALAAAPLPFLVPAALADLPSPFLEPLSFLISLPGTTLSLLSSTPSAILSLFSWRT
ncbi:hypothetical protein AX16_004576, partial [Volvariella volvacea WC 439]